MVVCSNIHSFFVTKLIWLKLRKSSCGRVKFLVRISSYIYLLNKKIIIWYLSLSVLELQAPQTFLVCSALSSGISVILHNCFVCDYIWSTAIQKNQKSIFYNDRLHRSTFFVKTIHSAS